MFSSIGHFKIQFHAPLIIVNNGNVAGNTSTSCPNIVFDFNYQSINVLYDLSMCKLKISM